MGDTAVNTEAIDESIDSNVIRNDSDVKKSAKSAIVSSKVNLQKCPCGESKGCYYIICVNCRQEWHQDCVYLQGLDDKTIKLLTEWRCRYCDDPEKKFMKREVNSAMREELSRMTVAVTEAVKVSVREEQVKVVVSEANTKVAESWANIAKGAQKDLINDVVKESSKVALTESIQLIDSNLTEQRKRSRNIVMSGIIEKSGEDKDLKEMVCEILGGEITERDVLAAFRLGDSQKTRKNPRPILVKLRSEDDANYFHNNGRGYQVGGTGSNIWINPDLTQAEREAAYQKRVAYAKEKEKKEKESNQPRLPHVSDKQGPSQSENVTPVSATQGPSQSKNGL